MWLKKVQLTTSNVLFCPTKSVRNKQNFETKIFLLQKIQKTQTTSKSTWMRSWNQKIWLFLFCFISRNWIDFQSCCPSLDESTDWLIQRFRVLLSRSNKTQLQTYRQHFSIILLKPASPSFTSDWQTKTKIVRVTEILSIRRAKPVNHHKLLKALKVWVKILASLSIWCHLTDFL